PTPRLRGEGRGEGESRHAQRAESPPHPAPSAPTSPRKRGAVERVASTSVSISDLALRSHVEDVISRAAFHRAPRGGPARRLARLSRRPAADVAADGRGLRP